MFMCPLTAVVMFFLHFPVQFFVHFASSLVSPALWWQKAVPRLVDIQRRH